MTLVLTKIFRNFFSTWKLKPANNTGHFIKLLTIRVPLATIINISSYGQWLWWSVVVKEYANFIWVAPWENRIFAYAKTTKTHEADQRLCFRYTDSTIPLHPKCKISSLWPFSEAAQPGLCRTWSETPKFSDVAAHFAFAMRREKMPYTLVD